MSTVPIPPRFLERMQSWLGEEFPAFLSALHQPPQGGLRVNPLKISVADFLKIAPFELQPIPWCPEGFLVSSEGRPGKHPYHAAGLYYLQEPSAMAVVELLDPQPGERILDLAAAPGGKATHIAGRLQGQGLLVANDLHPQRVWDLVKNLERWGAKNVLVTSEPLYRLAEQWGAFFDRVLFDAPCSGEGMFRRSLEARLDWSLEIVRACAVRQSGLLPQAARLVRPGGRLVYSTCTFAPEENEGVIARFLQGHAEFELLEVQTRAPFDRAHPEWLGLETPLAGWPGVYRLFPHHGFPEGHFIAVMRRRSGGEWREVSPFPIRLLAPSERRKVQQWLSSFSSTPIDPLRLTLLGRRLYFLPPAAIDTGRLRVLRPGWFLGELKKNRFEPSHAFLLALRAEELPLKLDLPAEHPAITKYLTGEVLPETLFTEYERAIFAHQGWLAICVDGHPLGWGRVVERHIKNLFPKAHRLLP
ncbi:MAG: RsmB/NOP family class I SAM-dependent RNA methyltransferase [Anaerolineales bacterium]|nr:RsmB/NOP family class I SAM-dependent RNA methyltransferase [Anaerolineales bacterium]MDW8445826.1 RsmB/NOP family class I SAM-dependent RNA methyltransferase [Anaerolineales bacterium]